MKSESTVAVLIVMNEHNHSMTGAKEFVQHLRTGALTLVEPLSGRVVGCHIEDLPEGDQIDGKNIGLSGLNPPIKPEAAFHIKDFIGLRCFLRLGPDLPSTPWAAVIEVNGIYEIAE